MLVNVIKFLWIPKVIFEAETDKTKEISDEMKDIMKEMKIELEEEMKTVAQENLVLRSWNVDKTKCYDYWFEFGVLDNISRVVFETVKNCPARTEFHHSDVVQLKQWKQNSTPLTIMTLSSGLLLSLSDGTNPVCARDGIKQEMLFDAKTNVAAT